MRKVAGLLQCNREPWNVPAGNVNLAQSNSEALQVLSGGWNVALRLGPSRSKGRIRAGPVLLGGLAHLGFRNPTYKGEPGAPSHGGPWDPLMSGPASYRPCLPAVKLS